MGNDTKDKDINNVTKKILEVVSFIWVAFCALCMIIIIIASNNNVGKLIVFLVLSIIASPAIIYILKRRKTKKTVFSKSNVNTEQEQVIIDNKNDIENTEVLSDRKDNTPQRLIPFMYLKKKKKGLLVLFSVLGVIIFISYINFLGVVRNVKVTNITINKDSSDINSRVNLKVNIQGLGNYFIEEAYIYKKEDLNKKNFTEKPYVDAYNLTAVAGKTLLFNSKDQSVDTCLNKKLYNSSIKATRGVEGEYVLVVKSKMNQVVSNVFTISKQMIDEVLLAEQLQKDNSKEAARQKEIKDKKAAEEAMAKQKEEDLLREQTEKNRYVKISDDGYTLICKIYVEAGKSLRVYGDAGGLLRINVNNESGGLIDTRLLNPGTYDEMFAFSTKYNGYYLVELKYNKHYKYNYKFNVQ